MRLIEPGQAIQAGMYCVEGVIQDVIYVGMITRYQVKLDSGQEVIVVEQNLEARPDLSKSANGRRVNLAWPTSANSILNDE